MKIGRYEIKLGRYSWVQTLVPTTVRRFLCFWILREVREVRPQDVNNKPRFPEGTVMIYRGQQYRYWKATKSMEKGEVVISPKD